MKILFLGEIGEGQTSSMRMRALKRLGHEVVGVHTIAPWRGVPWASRQLQCRLQRGPVVEKINCTVLGAAQSIKPDIIWGEK